MHHDLLAFFWERCGQPLLMALAAANVCSIYSVEFAEEIQDQRPLEHTREAFTDRANELVEKAEELSLEKAMLLLTTPIPRLRSKMTPMQLAYSGQTKKFITSTSIVLLKNNFIKEFSLDSTCQEVNNSNLMRGFESLSVFRCFTTVLCPLLILTRWLKFREDIGTSNDGRLTVGEKFLVFYRAPMTKYTTHWVNYGGFVILYSYIGLFGYRYGDPNNYPIIVLFAWVIALTAEEIMEVDSMHIVRCQVQGLGIPLSACLGPRFNTHAEGGDVLQAPVERGRHHHDHQLLLLHRPPFIRLLLGI